MKGDFPLRVWRGLCGAVFVLLAATFFRMPASAAQPAEGTVLVVQIRDTIDLGLAPYLERVLDHAHQENVQAVILELNTPGGRLDAALQMRDALLGSPVRTIAFVNREALSAGALIATAANQIYMAPGAVIGAATPVTGAGTVADEKTISAVRSIFRATAEQRGRDPAIAEAMVDPAVAIEGLVDQGNLLTLTTGEALQAGYIDGVAANRQELLERAGLAAAAVQESDLSLAERLVRFLTNPAIAALLIAAGLLLIIVDMLSEGFGLPGMAGIALLALFFWGHMLVGLAGWEGIALVVIGLVLLALEVFVVPGFGVTGVLGIIALLGGLFLSLIGGEIVTTADVVRAGYTVLGAALLLIVGMALMVRLLPRMGRAQGLILLSRVGAPTEGPPRRRRPWLEGPRLEAQTRPSETERASLRGAVGIAISDLRPGGIAQIAGERVDVVTRGDYIAAGEQIEVVADEGYRRVVRRLERRDGKE
jgi:membrane-bound serine protease (ClpP class)